MNAELQKVLERVMPAVYFDGDFDQALKDLIWLYEHSLEIESTFVAVRNSYVLGFWAMLAKKHPPADLALKELGETKINLLLTGEQDCKVLESHEIERVPLHAVRKLGIIGHAAIDEYGGAGDVGAGVGRQHRDQPGDVLHLPHAAQRNLAEQILQLPRIAPHRAVDVGLNRSRRQRQRAHTEGRRFLRHGLGHHGDRCLARSVGAVAAPGDRLAGRRDIEKLDVASTQGNAQCLWRRPLPLA